MRNAFKSLLFLFIIFSTFVPAVAQGQLFSFGNEMVGKPAPDFTLPDLSFQKINLTQYRDGKKAFVFIWATWCPHCRKQLQELNGRLDQYEQQGIKILTVDLGEGKDIVSAYVKKFNINAKVLLDDYLILEEQYHLIGVPTLFVIDEKGIVTDVRHNLPDL